MYIINMINYYEQFIKPKEIVKDINFYFNLMNELIINDLFGQYLYNKRKKINTDEYIIENFLSKYNNTRLRFNNDTIKVKFILKKNDFNEHKCECLITNPVYKNYRIDGIVFNLNIIISPQEVKNKLIYPQNQSIQELRKNIHLINEFYVKKLRKVEESKFKIVFNKLIKLKPSYYSDWNKLINLMIDCVDPYFNQNLNTLGEVIKSMYFKNAQRIYKMTHQTQFFLKYTPNKHIKKHKYTKFIEFLTKDSLDDVEIISLTNNLAKCLGHSVNNLNDSAEFIENVTNHFNILCHVRSMKINTYVLNVWEKHKN